MNELPVGWAQALLNDVVDIRDHEREPVNATERAARIAEKRGAELFPYYGATGQVGLIDGFRSEGERVLLGEDAAPFLDSAKDKAFIANGRFWVNNHAHVLTGYEGVILNHFLLHQLNVADYGPFVSGSTRLKLTNSAMCQIPVLVAPFAEQSRIVAKLEELLSDLDAGVAELKAAQAKLGQYRQSLLKAAVDGSLTAEWRRTHTPSETGAQLLERILVERRQRWEAKQLAKFREQGKTPPNGWQNHYPNPVSPDTTNLPELPEGWVWATIEQLTDFVTSGSRGWAEYYSEQGAVFIRSQNINTDKLCLDDVAFVDPPRGSEGARTKVQKHDLLLTITGANVGKVALVDVELEEAFVSQHVALLRPTIALYCKYLHLYLTAKAGGRAQLDKAAYGAGKPGLNLTQVASVTVPLPPAAEMSELMSQLALGLDSIDVQLDVVFTTQATAAAQRKNILKAAFSGQLVPQDPHDEPASVLLERIRAERAAQGAKGVKRGRKANA